MTYAVETIFTLFLTPNTSLLEFNRLFKSYANLNEKTNCITIELLEFFIDLEFESSSHTCTVTIFTPLVFWDGFLSTSFLFNCTPSLPYHAAHPQWVLSLMQPPYSPEYPPPSIPLRWPSNTWEHPWWSHWSQETSVAMVMSPPLVPPGTPHQRSDKTLHLNIIWSSWDPHFFFPVPYDLLPDWRITILKILWWSFIF